MSWLARSIVNSLKLGEDDDDDDHTNDSRNSKPETEPNYNQSSPVHSSSSSDPNTPRGVKEDISELTKTLTRQFWGVASFLAPSPPPSSDLPCDHTKEEEISLRPPSNGPDEASDDALIAAIRSDLSEIGGKFKTGISKLSENIAVSEFTRIASNFIQFGSEEESLEKYDSENVVGLTEEVVAFARDIAMHPETWLDFPLPDDDDFDDFDLSDAQQEHALAVEHLAPRLAALRSELCPGYMSEGCFWKIYFVLLHPRLNKHDAELLSTPQIVEARAMLMQGLQYRAKAKIVEDHSESGTSKITADLAREESLSLPSSTQSKAVLLKPSGNEVAAIAVAVEIETEKHPVQSTEMQVVDKSIIEEEPMKETKHQHSKSGSSGVSIEKFEDDADDWLKQETSEAVSTSATTIPLGNDEDVSFSDLEDDDDVPVSYKKVTSGSDPSTKDTRDWVQLGRSCPALVKDVSCVDDKHPMSEQVSARNPETKESNERESLKWLDSKEPKSVVYICFGSMTNFTSAQLKEIAMALEASELQFIWVVRKKQKDNEEDEDWLPEGFEKRIEGKGLIIRGWAPQVLILDHEAVGGFVTHCGWNSTLEGISAGVPMVTWPVFAEQFYNEKLVTQVLKIGVAVGVQQWKRTVGDFVKKEAIEKAVKEIMKGDKGEEMRNRAKALAEAAKKAVEKGGSSDSDLKALIEELSLRRH